MTSENKEEHSKYHNHVALCKHLYRHFNIEPESEKDYETGETIHKLAFVDRTFPSEKQTTTLSIDMRDLVQDWSTYESVTRSRGPVSKDMFGG